ncbi:GIY-YIG nuclease family protein [Nisaea sp.]|uniref:GIY-YIG nuclease family protein n=1 Tax=Nisaea sp. TaxID=2024842 RepID=UPI0032EC7F8A
MRPFVYILASKRLGVLYTGVTSDLLTRIAQHKSGAIAGFTKRYNVHDLVYFEPHETMEDAIRREHQVKRWKRHWKVEMIERHNPEWRDRFRELF